MQTQAQQSDFHASLEGVGAEDSAGDKLKQTHKVTFGDGEGAEAVERAADCAGGEDCLRGVEKSVGRGSGGHRSGAHDSGFWHWWRRVSLSFGRWRAGLDDYLNASERYGAELILTKMALQGHAGMMRGGVILLRNRDADWHACLL